MSDPFKKAKILELKNLIRQVDKLHGGNDKEFLETYIMEKGKEYTDASLEKVLEAIICFQDLLKQAELMFRKSK